MGQGVYPVANDDRFFSLAKWEEIVNHNPGPPIRICIALPFRPHFGNCDFITEVSWGTGYTKLKLRKGAAGHVSDSDYKR